MSEKQDYDEAVSAIKTAILQSQYDAAKTVNEKQLMLYYSIGKYISLNSRNGFWGKGAIDAFLHIGFTHHRVILGKIKNLDERLFYIKRCAEEHFTVDALKNVCNIIP